MLEFKDFLIPIVLMLSLISGFLTPVMYYGSRKGKVCSYIIFGLNLTGVLILMPAFTRAYLFGSVLGLMTTIIGLMFGSRFGLYFWKGMYPDQFKEEK